MFIYVRFRLVFREVVLVSYGLEFSFLLVEYIKIDVICDKELIKWDVNNVWDFIVVIDCKDKVEFFLEEVCIWLKNFVVLMLFVLLKVCFLIWKVFFFSYFLEILKVKLVICRLEVCIVFLIGCNLILVN